MKRKMLLCTLGLAALLLLGGCNQQQSRMGYIGAENAKAAALSDAGLTLSDVEFTGSDLSTRDGKDYYQIAFRSGDQEYAYDVDAVTGVIIESRLNGVTQGAAGQSLQDAAQSQQGSLVTDADTFESTTDKLTSAVTQDTPPETVPLPDGAVITEESARAKALEHAGLSETEVSFVKSRLDYDDGRRIYDVEFHTSDYKEYDYDVDAQTGEILSFDFDAESYAPPAQEGSSNALTADEAKDLALSQVPGAAYSDIREFEVDYDDGRLQYEGTIVYNGIEYEFEIDGYSGSFRNWESESIYD